MQCWKKETLTKKMNADEMRRVLGSHPDLKEEKYRVERFIFEKGLHAVKFHPELNPIEKNWGEAKRYTKAYWKYTLPALKATIHPALASVTLGSILNHFRKVRHYMFAYLERANDITGLEHKVKQYKPAIKGHNKISENQ